MRVGDIITGMIDETAHETYQVLEPLGMPGLFGQAFLCRRTSDSIEAVVKTLRAGRGIEDRERFLQEARTIERITAFEQRAGVHYVVRLLAQNAADATEPFIVLERASGQNVLFDLIEPIVDWQHTPLDEQLAIDIAWRLAHALCIVHQAGICYDDMKLDNLFWNSDCPNSPLRIIDWNVTSTIAERGGVAGDWARFGARLYELRTGMRLGIDSAGTLLGPGPSGPAWRQLPDGVRDIIEKALHLRYLDDDTILRDLTREREHMRLAWPDLLEQATIADGDEQIIEVLAPLARAEQLLQTLNPDDPTRADALARCAELRQRAEARRGIASARTLEYALRSLEKNEPRLAAERLQRAYTETGGRDPRPRRWLWVAHLASDQAHQYRTLRDDLHAAAESLNQDDPHTALTHLSEANQAIPGVAVVDWLLIEAEALHAAAEDRPEEALGWFEKLPSLRERYPDLQAIHDQLRRQRTILQQRQVSLAREQKLREIALRHADEAAEAEEQQDDERAIVLYERALAAIEHLLRDGCTPEAEHDARTTKHVIGARIEQLNLRHQARQIPERARSADPRQRQSALALATQIMPDWPDLAHLRQQVRQIDACFNVLKRTQAAERPELIDQALAALDVLESIGIRLDLAGADLQILRQSLVERRAWCQNNQARTRILEANKLLDQAASQLNPTWCDEAHAILQAIERRGLSDDVDHELIRAVGRTAELDRLIEHAIDKQTAIEQARAAGDLNQACRTAQRLAKDYPQLPGLAAIAIDLERDLWLQIAAAAHETSEMVGHLNLKKSTIADLNAIEARRSWLTMQRQDANLLADFSEEQHASLRKEADHALSALKQTQTEWEQRRGAAIQEVQQQIDQAERALQHGDDRAACEIIERVREICLPPDAIEQGLEPLLIRIERLDSELTRRREGHLARLHDLEARIQNPTAHLRYDELIVPFSEPPTDLDPYVRPTWERVREHANILRQHSDRVDRPDQIKEYFTQIETTIKNLGRTIATTEHLAEVDAALKDLALTTQTLGQQLKQHHIEIRQTQQKLTMGVVASLILVMIALGIIII